MGLESGTYIADLVPTNPTGTDPVSAGDDHLRLIKSVLQNTFPGQDGPAKLREVISVTDYGAKGDGVADDTAAIQAAVTAAGANSTISFPDGTYKITTSVVVLADNVHLALGTSVIDASAFTGWTNSGSSDWNSGRNKAVFEVRGAVGATTTLTVAAENNSRSITVASASGIAIGDIVEIRSDNELWYTYGTTPIPIKEINEVSGVSGNVLTLTNPLKWGYSITGHVVTVEANRPNKNSAITGGTINGAGFIMNMLNGFGPVGVFVEGFKDFTMRDVRISKFQNKAACFRFGMGYLLQSCRFRGLEDSYTDPIVEDQNSGFYGFWGQQERFGIVQDVSGYRVRHIVDGQTSMDRLVDSCHASATHASAYTTHDGSDNWTFSNNYCDNSVNYACNWRGFSARFIGNTWFADLDGSSQYGWIDQAGAVADKKRAYYLSGNRINSVRSALLIRASNIKELVICDNPALIASGGGAFHPVQIESNSIDRLLISGNAMTGSSGSSIGVSSASLVNGNHLVVTENNLEGYTGVPINILSPATSLGVVAKDNTLIPGSGGSGVASYPARTSGAYRLGPNYTASGELWDGRNGIKLGNYADSDPATLDWYEEGTSTAGLELTIGGASTGITYGNRTLSWVRIGRHVFFAARVNLTSKGALSGAVAITLGNGYNSIVSNKGVALSATGLGAAVGDTSLSAQIVFNTNSVRLYKQAAGQLVQFTEADITNGSDIYVTGTYLCA